MSNITEIFERLMKENNLHVISIGANLKQSGEYRWNATAHWAGYSNSGIPCASESAPTPEEAIRKTLIAARNDRTPMIEAEIEPITIGDVA